MKTKMKRKPKIDFDAFGTPVLKATWELWGRYDRTLWGITTADLSAEYVTDRKLGGDRVRVTELADACLVSSERPDGKHAVTLDLDVPAALYPSSTKGHSHLYIDVAMPWWKYALLLRMLAWCGVLERGYVGASLHKGGTFLRLPWVVKT